MAVNAKSNLIQMHTYLRRCCNEFQYLLLQPLHKNKQHHSADAWNNT